MDPAGERQRRAERAARTDGELPCGGRFCTADKGTAHIQQSALYGARSGGGYIPIPQGGGYYHEDNLSALSERDEIEYSMGWKTDWIEVYVSERGIESVGWYNPNEYVMEANENVRLMPFDEIQQHIREDFRFSYAWAEDTARRIKALTIDRIVLSCAIDQLANQPDEAVLVPAWVILYRSDQSELAHDHEKLMVINAIDGSYLHVN